NCLRLQRVNAQAITHGTENDVTRPRMVIKIGISRSINTAGRISKPKAANNFKKINAPMRPRPQKSPLMAIREKPLERSNRFFEAPRIHNPAKSHLILSKKRKRPETIQSATSKDITVKRNTITVVSRPRAQTKV